MKSEEAVSKVYGSVEDLVASGASEVEYAFVEGFKPGEQVRIGSVSAGDMIQWTEENENPDTKKTAGLRLIVKSLVDDKGVRYAMPQEAKNIQAFRSMRHKETERVVKAILELNGMKVKDEAKKG